MGDQKKPLTFEQQADRLISLGFQADRDSLVAHLKYINYYRIKGYLYPFRQTDKTFEPGTTFEKVSRQYVFDRRLRVLLMEAIERIEVAVRTQVVYHFSHDKGPLGYREHINLPKLREREHKKFIKRLDNEFARSNKKLINRDDLHLKDPQKRPLWQAAEFMSFGMLFKFFRGVEKAIRRKTAEEFGIPTRVLWSWLYTLNNVRNICAHHSRLWNQEFREKPLIPNERKHPEWHTPVQIKNNRVFVILTILKYLLKRISLKSKWPSRFIHLLNEYTEIPLREMGFPENWITCPLWKDCKGKLDRSRNKKSKQ
jgi:abortive infection bacteriophage resistance protein